MSRHHDFSACCSREPLVLSTQRKRQSHVDALPTNENADFCGNGLLEKRVTVSATSFACCKAGLGALCNKFMATIDCIPEKVCILLDNVFVRDRSKQR